MYNIFIVALSQLAEGISPINKMNNTASSTLLSTPVEGLEISSSPEIPRDLESSLSIQSKTIQSSKEIINNCVNNQMEEVTIDYKSMEFVTPKTKSSIRFENELEEISPISKDKSTKKLTFNERLDSLVNDADDENEIDSSKDESTQTEESSFDSPNKNKKAYTSSISYNDRSRSMNRTNSISYVKETLSDSDIYTKKPIIYTPTMEYYSDKSIKYSPILYKSKSNNFLSSKYWEKKLDDSYKRTKKILKKHNV